MSEGAAFEKALDKLENAWGAVGFAQGDSAPAKEYHARRDAVRQMFRRRVSKSALLAWLGMWRPHVPHEAVLEMEALMLAEDG